MWAGGRHRRRHHGDAGRRDATAMTSTVTRDRSEIAGREEENGVMRRKYQQQLATERGGRAAVVFGGRRGGNTTAGQRVTVKLEKDEYEEGRWHQE